MTEHEKRKIKDLIEWPPSSWSTFGYENLLLDSARGTIEKALIVSDGISLSALQNGKSFTAHIEVKNIEIRNTIAQVLNKNVGKTVNQTGNVEVA